MAEHKTLAQALLAFQGDAKTLPKNAENPHFHSKFTPLDTIVEHVGPLLTEHGLVWTTLPCRDEHGDPALMYRLIHAATGEALQGVMPLMLAKQDPQGQGSAITYARRYSLTAVLNLVADADDDGEAARKAAQARSQAGNGSRSAQPTADAVTPTDRKASAKQRGLINARASEASLAPSDLADVIRRAANSPIRMYDTDEQAQQDVNRLLDRLPARLVDPVLEGIAAKVNDGTPV